MSGNRLAKALVVGAQGQVGSQLVKALEAQRGEGHVLPTARAPKDGWLQLDLAELRSEAQAGSLLDRHELNAVLCVGGMTFVDGCEAEPDLADRINAQGPGVLAAYARRCALPFVYFSTEYVFDGSQDRPGPYVEDDAPHPLSVYGRSKLAGERAVMDAHPGSLVIRTTVVYGPDAREKNYVYSLLRNLAAGTPMRVPADQISTPTYNRDLASVTIDLVERGASGIYHVCGPEVLGRLEFAQRVASAFGLDGSLLQGVSTAELEQVAPRPLDAGLRTAKLRRGFPELTMRGVAESLDDCRAEMQAFVDRNRNRHGSGGIGGPVAQVKFVADLAGENK